MAKISQVSAKYIVHSTIEIEGVVDRPDVIGAIFGQTEGLLGADLELRELQRSGRIGRIEVEMSTKGGKTSGKIIIPSSLDKAETSIIGASLEIIQRIGPCNAKIKIENIEDIRISKREFVITRAKELLKKMISTTSPDSQELSDEVANSVRIMEITEYGPDRLSAGPAIDESDEIIIVEGRADVLNLLKHGFKNIIATNGTNTVSKTIIDLSKKKTCTIFTDGDRGGDLIIKGLMSVAEVDFVTKAPDGKEVEEITKKEIHKSLRAKIAAEQMKFEIEKTSSTRSDNKSYKKPEQKNETKDKDRYQTNKKGPQYKSPNKQQYSPQSKSREQEISSQDKAEFKKLLEDLVGTNGAYILNDKKEILGKVPISELNSTIKSLGSGVYAIILDGTLEQTLVSIAEKTQVKIITAMESKIKPNSTRINILTVDDL